MFLVFVPACRRTPVRGRRYVDVSSGAVVGVAEYNPAFLFFSDSGSNDTAANINTTANQLGFSTDDLVSPTSMSLP